ncbi:hypothetical protein GCM10007423_09190 [Dyadobacter endophyticus]|uniref:C1q domain-containing protein n=1 Tax=Dyadobacter endophyticus TaxID=1749036 RepID=A0ABQ1YHG7_9BACT|nr:hypothetical protein [Dyadobacter endophyticus]GGH25175.1 hypothetical protein GCM10007423_09190 [Dyadobacter endophyticus]
MKKSYQLLLTGLFAVLTFAANAQVGVGTISPAPTAQLDVQSTSKGLLIPRMLDSERTGIASPATGLLVYQTNGSSGFYYFDGVVWRPLHSGDAVGFTATKNALAINASGSINDFNQEYAAGPGLNVVTGAYTVPETGIYHVSAIVNYSTTAAVSVSLGAGVDPKINLRANGVTNKLTGNFPLLNVNVALVLSLRAILGSGTVVLSGDVPLTAGDVLDLYYEADGLSITLNLGSGGTDNGIVWSMRKL